MHDEELKISEFLLKRSRFRKENFCQSCRFEPVINLFYIYIDMYVLNIISFAAAETLLKKRQTEAEAKKKEDESNYDKNGR